MKINKSVSGIILIMIFLVGCVRVTSSLNDEIVAANATQAGQIKVYAARTIEGNYYEMGALAIHSLEGSTPDLMGNRLRDLIKEEAAKIGADAVIAFRIDGVRAQGIAVKYN